METSRPKDAAVKRQCLVNALCYGLSRAPVERYCSESQSIIVGLLPPSMRFFNYHSAGLCSRSSFVDTLGLPGVPDANDYGTRNGN